MVHAYTLFTDGNCARALSKKYGIPYGVAVRNTDVNNFFKMMPHLRGRGIKIMLGAKAVFFLSEAYREQVFEKLDFSARAYDKVLRVARTIADLENEATIDVQHISRAVQFRSLDRKLWRK